MIAAARLAATGAEATLDRAFLSGAAEGLAEEIERWTNTNTNAAARPLARAARRLADEIAGAAPQDFAAGWERHWAAIDRLGEAFGSARNAGARYAHAYPSMTAFFADAEAQRLGASDATFWDTYEHGRRRQIEHAIAGQRGHGAALLVNSGMSAIAVALGSAGLGPGDTLLTGTNGYFETSALLAEVVGHGVTVVRVDLDDACAWQRAVAEVPKVILLETVENGPAGRSCPPPGQWLGAARSTLILIDNSLVSAGCDWAALARRHGVAERLVAAESAAKYLSQTIVAGMLLGAPEAIERCRAQARNHGQQLQERLFNYLRQWEIEGLATRWALHDRNARRFHARVTAGLARPLALFRRVDGALVYVQLPEAGDGASRAIRHRRLLEGWVARCGEVGTPVAIRAGFGWRQTTARCYEGNYLNQRHAPDYLRLSIGIEPEARIDAIADGFLAALEEAQ
ncbi:MAG: hypothetical protein B7Y43_00215 [Sphingomonas sp. 28-62-20]|uniref:PLP-dependent transferase n=1 Tax=Sphingomonas sp. 28-62-20 TaxID=1970433 RepID=UPI000BD7C9EE|nr:MAG: hypothetical protein B7Y43_00215 [Sphingomonas sp. 28-62-20]